MINSLKLLVTQNKDQGATRLIGTTLFYENQFNIVCKTVASNRNLRKRILKDETINAMEKLKVHIRKGCLSGIPVYFGTYQNEFLHRILNKVVKKSRISIQQAISALGLFFYQWNERKLLNLNITQPVETHAFEESDIHEKISVQNTLNYSSLQPVPTERNSFIEMPLTDSTVSSEDEYDNTNENAEKKQHISDINRNNRRNS